MRVTLKISGDMQGKRELEFDEPGEYIIGRIDKSNIVISDPSASKRHAKIVIDAMGARLVDLNSTNGTVVDGVLLGGGPEARKGTASPTSTLVRESSSGEDFADSRAKQANLRNGSLIEIGGAQMQVFMDLGLIERERINEWIIEGERKVIEAIQIFQQVLAMDPNNTRANMLMRHGQNLFEQFERKSME